jgi:hypothetical protein
MTTDETNERMVTTSDTVRMAALVSEQTSKQVREVAASLSQRFTSMLTTYVPDAISQAEKVRQATEDERAIKRNRNRMLILVVVLAMELVVPTLAGIHVLPMIMVKYEVLCITAPDIALTMYAYFKRY